MSEIWNTLFIEPLVNGLVFFYQLTGNLGMAIILFTIFIRFLLIPLTLPSLRAAQKMRELTPYLDRIKKRHKDDRAKLAQAQAELYRQHGVNPLAGCLPQIIQIVILIALFNVFFRIFTPTQDTSVATKLNEFLWPFLQLPEDTTIDLRFLHLDLVHPDVFSLPPLPIPLPGVFLIASSLVQFLSSKMMMPTLSNYQKQAQQTPPEMDNLAVSLQQSMLWTFPAMTLVVGYNFPSGLVLYWFIFSLFQMVQQYFTSGWGGLTPWLIKVGLLKLTDEKNKK